MTKWHVLAAGAALVPAIAAAQEQPTYRAKPDERSVAERYRPEYQPIGGRLGSFFLYPSLKVTSIATDNVLASDADKRSDAFAEVLGDAQLRSNWSRHSLNLDAFVSQSVHARQSTEDATEYGGQIDGRLDATRDANIGLVLRAERLVEDRSSYTSPTGAREPVRYGQLTGVLTSEQTFDRLELLTTVSVLRQRFRDTRANDGTLLSQKYRDVTIVSAGGSATYALTPDFGLLLSGTVDKRSYALPASDPLQPGNVDRDSSGGRIEAGVRLSLTSLLYGQIRAGYLVRHYVDGTLRDASGASFGADVLWNVTPLTSVRLSADRRVDEASSATIAGNRVTELSTTVDHELLRNVILTGVLRYADIAPLGPAPSSTEFGGRLAGRYLANRRLSLRGSYNYGQRLSDVPGRQYHENRGTLEVLLAF